MKDEGNKNKYVLVFSDFVDCSFQIYEVGYNAIYIGPPRELDITIESKMEDKVQLVLGNVGKFENDLSIKIYKAVRELAEVSFSPGKYNDYGPTRLTKKQFFAGSDTKLFIVYDNGKRYVNEALFEINRGATNTVFITKSMTGMYVRCDTGKASYNFSEVAQ